MQEHKIVVAILDGQQSTIDGYYYRLGQNPNIEIAGAASAASQFEDLLAQRPVDVAIVDVRAPTAPDNANPFPALHVLPQLLRKHASLAVLVVSTHEERSMIQALLDAGAKGYIFKDDGEIIRDLATVVMAVATGGVHLSRRAYELMRQAMASAHDAQLTLRQLEALSLCAARPGEPLETLAKQLDISPSTLRNTLANIYERLGVHTRLEAILKARELGLIASPGTEGPPDRRPREAPRLQ